MFGEDKLNNENNTYKQKPIKKEIKQIKQSIKLLKNLSSESLAQKPVNQRKEQVRGQYWTDYKQWQVAKVALILPILGKSFNRDFSPLKSYLVDWDRSVSRLVPVLGAGTIADSKYRLSGMSQLEMAEYKYTNLKCSEAFLKSGIVNLELFI